MFSSLYCMQVFVLVNVLACLCLVVLRCWVWWLGAERTMFYTACFTLHRTERIPYHTLCCISLRFSSCCCFFFFVDFSLFSGLPIRASCEKSFARFQKVLYPCIFPVFWRRLESSRGWRGNGMQLTKAPEGSTSVWGTVQNQKNLVTSSIFLLVRL